MLILRELDGGTVHCRTGSLEKVWQEYGLPIGVHCRTGSLESFKPINDIPREVHCRTGSLEIIECEAV